ncbi:hypothetical protein GCM10011579_095670 [Streptomyces albiflavescens]|uniref:Uncharacterized protein n=1 Tax=Streptomyces albiflavescens TaxID=1623582 RepID=A0A918DA93_9ACTN|nr:hypothetical protein [Streptomyces albiflavescens]GGN95280.1 hypothetical protein GCM10011579_095670 [Streptomyces albiflavescens]
MRAPAASASDLATDPKSGTDLRPADRSLPVGQHRRSHQLPGQIRPPRHHGAVPARHTSGQWRLPDRPQSDGLPLET